MSLRNVNHSKVFFDKLYFTSGSQFRFHFFRKRKLPNDYLFNQSHCEDSGKQSFDIVDNADSAGGHSKY